MDVGAIREGLERALGGLGYTPYAYSLGDIDPPAFVIGLPVEVQYGTTIADGNALEVPVTVYVSTADAEDAVVRMDAALSTGVDGSIYDALRAARSSAWRGRIVVPLVNEVGPTEDGAGRRLLSAVFRCQLLAS